MRPIRSSIAATVEAGRSSARRARQAATSPSTTSASKTRCWSARGRRVHRADPAGRVVLDAGRRLAAVDERAAAAGQPRGDQARAVVVAGGALVAALGGDRVGEQQRGVDGRVGARAAGAVHPGLLVPDGVEALLGGVGELPVAGLVEAGGGGRRGQGESGEREGERGQPQATAAASREAGGHLRAPSEPAGGRAAWGWADPAGWLSAGGVTSIMRSSGRPRDGAPPHVERGQHAPSRAGSPIATRGETPATFFATPVARSTRGQPYARRVPQAGPDPPARRHARPPGCSASGWTRAGCRTRSAARGSSRRCPTRATTRGSPRSATTAWPATCTTPRWPPSASCSRSRGRARRAGAGPLLRRPGARRGARAPRSARRRWRSWAGGRSRPMTPDLVPAGPWLEWHYERFCTPPGATELARTADAPQAFRLGPHLGVQFHPEATVEIVEGWARADAGRGSRRDPRRAGAARRRPERRVPPLRRLPRRRAATPLRRRLADQFTNHLPPSG